MAALQGIDALDAKTNAKKVFDIFSAISSMDASGAIAAYYTFRFFFENRERQDEITEKRIEMIDDALVTRMKHICAATPKIGRRALALAFVDAIGDGFWSIKFRSIIDSP